MWVLQPSQASSDILIHYGVPGMKWGVRKDRKSQGRKRTMYSTKAARDAARTVAQSMRSIKYANFTKLLSPSELKRRGSGSCHDQVMLELDEFSKRNVKAQARFVMEYDPKTNKGGTTHSFVYIPHENGIIWIENAWGDQRGIHEFKSLNECEQYIRKRYNSAGAQFTSMAFTDFKPALHTPGESLQELVDICLNDCKE